jgi:hypothetical protein
MLSFASLFHYKPLLFHLFLSRKNRYGKSAGQVVMKVFYDHEWLPWKFEHTPKHWADDVTQLSKYIKSIEPALRILLLLSSPLLSSPLLSSPLLSSPLLLPPSFLFPLFRSSIFSPFSSLPLLCSRLIFNTIKVQCDTTGFPKTRGRTIIPSKIRQLCTRGTRRSLQRPRMASMEVQTRCT